MSKKISLSSGIVYSTDPDMKFEKIAEEPIKNVAPSEQKIQVRLDRKHRGGKTVTLVEGFIGNHEEKETLGKKLKTFCGTGGSVKDGEILVQGDNSEKVLQWLLKNGYKNAKKI